MQEQELREWDVIAVIDTALWIMKFKLFPDITSKTFENFTTHSMNWYYNNTVFHRVIANFMVQWWDPTATWMWGKSIFWEEFEDEISPNLRHIKWALSMANAWPNTNGSQFFIVHAPKTPWLDWHHTVFWQIIEGMDILDIIATQRTKRDDRPLFDITINSVEIKSLKSWEFIPYAKS
ncbi:MAG: hypothetical protein ACD_3C00213G0008 [uncultured bacterium (gcode 4)]|uniref:Peptidyl-prolyl cis-trans isomerase n=1 Tax=uncultured bacterium (gcode 4) TaxID=1234023 RepID=K2GB35_9BACT|nr:MAG: hypothetical protein ACD_3C00213G0008 [uncultured bacterium (gcode 4)]